MPHRVAQAVIRLTVMIMTVVVVRTVAVTVTVVVVMIVAMVVIVTMVVVVVVAVVVMTLRVGPGHARVLAEHQRLDRHRNRVGRHAYTPQIDIVKIPERYSVDGKYFGLDLDLILHQRPQRLRNIAVEHKIKGRRAARVRGMACAIPLARAARRA